MAQKWRPAAVLVSVAVLLLLSRAAEARKDPEAAARIAAIAAQLPTRPIGWPEGEPIPRLDPDAFAKGDASPQAPAAKPQPAKPCKPLRTGMPKASADEKRSAKYFDKVRNHAASLTQFMKLMPKGGDIHTHYSGTIATEELISAALSANLTLCVTRGTPAWGYAVTSADAFVPGGINGCGTNGTGWRVLGTSQALSPDGILSVESRNTMLESWSIYNFPRNSMDVVAGATHFFDSFARFGAANDAIIGPGGPGRIPSLLRLKKQAMEDNIQFYEMMYGNIRGLKALPYAATITSKLRSLAAAGDDAALEAYINEVLDGPAPADANVPGAVTTSTGLAETDSKAVSDDKFQFRYQFHAARTSSPASVLMGLYACFLAAKASPYVVGVNLVAREDDRVALLDYHLHMVMLKVLRGRYPDVKLALHAGELTRELVAPVDLGFHVSEAVNVARAHRIGHGVDLPWEDDSLATLEAMRGNETTVEINLDSNDFILGVGADKHALQLYLAGCVPVIISSDDLGILRSSLTANFVMLAYYHPQVKYPAIKQMVYDSIRKSFFPDDIKAKLTTDLNQKYKEFEAAVAKTRFFADNEISLG